MKNQHLRLIAGKKNHSNNKMNEKPNTANPTKIKKSRALRCVADATIRVRVLS